MTVESFPVLLLLLAQVCPLIFVVFVLQEGTDEGLINYSEALPCQLSPDLGDHTDSSVLNELTETHSSLEIMEAAQP